MTNEEVKMSPSLFPSIPPPTKFKKGVVPPKKQDGHIHLTLTSQNVRSIASNPKASFYSLSILNDIKPTVCFLNGSPQEGPSIPRLQLLPILTSWLWRCLDRHIYQRGSSRICESLRPICLLDYSSLQRNPSSSHKQLHPCGLTHNT